MFVMALLRRALTQKQLDEARAAVENARRVRKDHARRSIKGTARREADIAAALDRLKEAMKPLRSEIARFQYGFHGEAHAEYVAEVREASQDIQRERRKLFKMQKHPDVFELPRQRNKRSRPGTTIQIQVPS